jgi:hypothetical protein
MACHAAGSGGVPVVPCDTTQLLPNCASSSQPATLRAVNLLILLDKSASMRKLGLGSTTSNWDAMKNALDMTLGRSKLTINFGLDLFPKADVTGTCTGETCCATLDLWEPLDVPVAPGTDSVPAILSMLASTPPAGGAPAAAALARALDYYTTGDGRCLLGDKYVLFVTAGGPNCHTAAVPACDAPQCVRNLDPEPTCNQETNCCGTPQLAINCLDDESVVTEIQNLKAQGVSTIVVGLPGSEPYAEYLNAFAVAGGQPNPDPGATTAYYAVAESAGVSGLAETLQRINVGLVKSCVIQYATPPDDPDLVDVLVDCNLVPRDPVDGGDGSLWTLDQAARTITLQGGICDQIVNGGAQRIDYIFGCVDPL